MAKSFQRRMTIDDLPLFASDLEIGIAVVGEQRAEHWASITVKRLETFPGFPKIDEAHGGRYVPAVKRYYEALYGAPGGQKPRVEDRPENPDAWRRPRGKKP